jgi:hypothetical protein
VSNGGTPLALGRVLFGQYKNNGESMPDNAKTLLKSAIVTHEGGHTEMAAEIFRRILMAYPGTAEARIAVYYLTEGFCLPPGVGAASARDAADPTLPDLSAKPGGDVTT